ncbi:uncharacterized protein PG998_015053 [Apiospora kogelbergensis]|uniref:uncharacterized protein n=1 Tax=Apiospora kogelbergensis TaxID=1337665 RepID=UPI0031326E5F
MQLLSPIPPVHTSTKQQIPDSPRPLHLHHRPISGRLPPTTAEKSAYLSRLRAAVADHQARVNEALTARMEADKIRDPSSAPAATTAPTSKKRKKNGNNNKKAEEDAEEENYGEEVVEEDDEV